VLLVAAAVVTIDVLRAPKKDEDAVATAGAHVDDNGLHDDEDACDHGDDDTADDDEHGATGDAAR